MNFIARIVVLILPIALFSCLDGAKKGSSSGGTTGNTEIKLDTLDQKVSYVFGQQIGREMKNQAVKVDVNILAQSIREAISGKESRMKPEEMQATMREMQTQMRKKRQAEAEENLKKGTAYLDKNKSAEGIKTTASGLQYKVLKPSDGKKPKETDVVRVHYKGTLTDGSEFDSSYKRGQAAEFPLNRVIKGWTEGLQLMGVGSKFEFHIPPGLAYGSTARPSIPANSVLIFEVELLGIVDKNKPADKKAKKGKK